MKIGMFQWSRAALAVWWGAVEGAKVHRRGGLLNRELVEHKMVERVGSDTQVLSAMLAMVETKGKQTLSLLAKTEERLMSIPTKEPRVRVSEVVKNMTLKDATTSLTGKGALASVPHLATLLQGASSMGKGFLTKKITDAEGGDSYGIQERLKDMQRVSQEQADNHVQECEAEATARFTELSDLAGQIATLSSAATLARGKSQEASSRKEAATKAIEEATEEKHRVHTEFTEFKSVMDANIAVLRHDIGLTEAILKNESKNCEEAHGTTTDTSLVQCPQCGGRTVLMSRGVALSSLMQSKHFAQAAAGVRSAESTVETSTTGDLQNMPLVAFTTPVPPEPVAEYDCVPDGRCVLTESNCAELQDKIATILSEMMDDLAGSERVLKFHQDEHDDEDHRLTEELEQQGEIKLSSEAEETREGSVAMISVNTAHEKAEYHSQMAVDFEEAKHDCCEKTKAFDAEICAYKRIRGEFDALKGNGEADPVDCEVADWEGGECSVTCGGGQAEDRRPVLSAPANGGLECPPLTKTVQCSTQVCPVDCVPEDWSAWSTCSSDCGGGVRERIRHERVAAVGDGAPCTLTNTQPCNAQACDPDCEYAEWSDWTSCSQTCEADVMHPSSYIQKNRGIEKEAGGAAEACNKAKLVDFKTDCTGHKSCQAFEHVPDDGEMPHLSCGMKKDITIVLENSLNHNYWVSLNKHPEIFPAFLNLAQELVATFDMNSTDGPKVAVVQYRPLQNASMYGDCIDPEKTSKSTAKDCGVKWVHKGSQDVQELHDLIGAINYRKNSHSTVTAKAVAEALARGLGNKGRADADHVIILMTPGWFANGATMLHRVTRNAQEKNARMVWVGTTRDAHDYFPMYAQMPMSSNALWEVDPLAITRPEVRRLMIAKIISRVCSDLIAPESPPIQPLA